MPAELSVRQANGLDAKLLSGLHRECFARTWDEAAMVQFAAAPGMLCLIAEAADGAADAKIAAGFLIARKAEDEAEILSFGVTPRFRKLGLGRALLKTAMTLLRTSGTARLFLEVKESNDAALRLYRSFGGVAVGRRRHYYDDGSDAAILSLAL